jgi:hypothetical protein
MPIFIQILKHPEPLRGLEGSGVVHVVEIFSPLLFEVNVLEYQLVIHFVL